MTNNSSDLEYYLSKIPNFKQELDEGYSSNLHAFNQGKDRIDKAIEMSKDDGFSSTYFSTEIKFKDNKGSEDRDMAIALGCLRMVIFRRWLEETYDNIEVTVDVVTLDNYHVNCRCIVEHGV